MVVRHAGRVMELIERWIIYLWRKAIFAGTFDQDYVRAMHRYPARNAELDLQARTDALTGLYNRRHFDELLALAWITVATRRGSSPSVPAPPPPAP
jgi:PleD family two-component response regulator